ncbi:MAG: ribonuclease P protein component [Verrucomicrobiota bacterium]|nr:ribonuclease P protein component [Verrucomicrobiota bacterium]
MIPDRALAFGRDRRLTSASEFARVRTEGQTARGALLVLGILETGEADPFRAGFVTSKRVGAAVVRNRVRRRLREITRRHQHETRAGLWLVVIARPPAARATYAALEDEYLRLAKRASILAP